MSSEQVNMQSRDAGQSPAAGVQRAILEASGLGKMYHLYDRPQDRLKQAFFWGKRKLYREFWALRDVSFAIQPGEVVGVIGRNGSGKSTLLQIAAGVLKPSAGKAIVRGRVAALLELGSGFNPEFTGRENVYMNATILGLSKQEIDARYQQIVDFAEIGQFIEQPVKTYSSGMYVRLAFAISVHVDADILVVDEALSVGDAAFQFKCLHRLEQLLDRGATILLVSHDTQLVKSYCTRAIYLSQGSIAYQGDCETAVEKFLLDMRSQQMAHMAAKIAAKPSLSSQGMRFGSEKGHILGVKMGCGDEQRNHFQAGERAWVEVTMQFSAPVVCPRLLMHVRDLKGYNLFGYGSDLAGVDLHRQPDGLLVARFGFDCRLRDGDYSIMVRLEDSVGDGLYALLDKQINAAVFKVLVREKRFSGVMDLAGTFEIVSKK